MIDPRLGKRQTLAEQLYSSGYFIVTSAHSSCVMSEEPQQKIDLLEHRINFFQDEELLMCPACRTRYAGQRKVEIFVRHVKETIV